MRKGDKAALTCSPHSGDTPIDIFWRRNGIGIEDAEDARYSIELESSSQIALDGNEIVDDEVTELSLSLVELGKVHTLATPTHEIPTDDEKDGYADGQEQLHQTSRSTVTAVPYA